MINLERDPEVLKARLNLETALAPWRELQRFFASGSAIAVDSSLDLVEVALEISRDNKARVQQWLASGRLGQVSDQQALAWYESGASVWTCVVKPWVLVQQRGDR